MEKAKYIKNTRVKPLITMLLDNKRCLTAYFRKSKYEFS